MLSLRILYDPPAGGAWNMAVDEALLASAVDNDQATLRFYTWQEPTLSLGYFQAAGERELHAASRSCALIRRSTGGGAILHDRELTYSLVAPRQASAGAARRLYGLVHGTLIEVLGRFGVAAALFRDITACGGGGAAAEDEPFLCFQRRTCFDVVIGGHKIAGSAQRRRGKAVLQHGSILLARSAFAPELAGITDVANVGLGAAELAATWALRMVQSLSMHGSTGELTDAERLAAAEFARTRFGNAEFVQRR